MTPTPEELSLVISRWRGSPLLFAREALRVELEDWQVEALEKVRTDDRVSVRAGHGVGKTALLSIVALWFLLTHFPCKIPVTANSQDQLRDVVWPEITTWARRLPPEFLDQLEITAERIGLKGATDQAFIVPRTASKERPEALQGFHSPNLLFLIEEASGIADIVFEVAQGALSTPGAKVLMLGNPTRLSGFFYDSHHILSHRWTGMRVNSEDIPRARGHIDDIIAKYGRDSNAYRIRVLGEFPTTEDQQVIPFELIQAAINRKVAPITTYCPVWGVDVARFGDDRTTLAKRRTNALMEPIKCWRGKDTMQVAGLIKHEWDETIKPLRPSEILVDVIGIGAGVVDRLFELGLPVRGINVAERPSSGDDYLRMRDQLWWEGRKWFEKRDVVICDDKELIAELQGSTYTFSSAGKIIIESKDEMKKRIGRSPDLADAFLLTMAAGIGVPAAERPSNDYETKERGIVSWMAA